MNKHYFFSLPDDELEFLKEEYLKSSTILFTKKYNISNKSVIELFWKKGMKWIVGRKASYSKPRIIKKTKFKTQNLSDSKFFKQWLHEKSRDPYYTLLFNRNK